MPGWRHWPPLMAAIVICLAVIGCGGSGGNAAGGSRSSPAPAGGAAGAPGPDGSAGAKGAPVDNAPNGGGGAGAPGALGAPIKIPAIVESQGAPIDDVMNSLTSGEPLPTETNSYNGIVAQCGGQLCVTLKARPGRAADGADGFTECQALGHTDPPAGSVVHAGDTIWVLTGSQPCTAPPGSDQSPGTGASPPGGDQSPGTDGSPGTGQSPADNSSP